MSSRTLAELLWVEKYRPKTLSEIVNQGDIVRRLQQFVKERNMPHLLFAGPPGTGKTTAAHAFAHDLYGPDYRMYMLELNASVSKNTPILVRMNGRTTLTTFAELDKLYFSECDGDISSKVVNDLEVLTIDEDLKVKWGRVTRIMRHKVPVVLRLKLEQGGILELTGNHSIMVLTEEGLKAVKASELKVGDFLLTFTANIEGRVNVPPVKPSIPKRSGEDVAIEGPTSEGGTLSAHASEASGPNPFMNCTPSAPSTPTANFNYLDALSADLVRFVKGAAVGCVGNQTAYGRRMPSYIFDLPTYARLNFLKGLVWGGGVGGLCSVIRLSSPSAEMLTDIVWLGRISGVETSLQGDCEVRLNWADGAESRNSGLVNLASIRNLIERLLNKASGDWRYVLRRQLCEGEGRISKEELARAISMVSPEGLDGEERKAFELLSKIANSDIHSIKITDIELVEYNDYVYDVSVPGGEMFFAGTVPVLLHNSDERGIDVIRGKVKEFSRSKLPANVPFKIVLLDESDNMTADAQQALRRLMEMYVDVTRFILVANYPSKIIEPIQSRCAVFRFVPLRKEDVVGRLRWICKNEGIKCDEEALEVIHDISEGDMRKSINILQASASIGEVNVSNVFKVVGLAHPREVREMMQLVLEGKFMEARDKLRELMITYGISGTDIIKQIHREVFSQELSMPEPLRVEIADYLGEIQFRLVEGADEEIQLNALLAKLALLGRAAKTIKPAK